MAVSYIWPLTLPQNVQKGFTESVGLNVLRTPTDSGPAKVRRRSVRPSKMSVSFFMTTVQVAQLETFVLNTIQGVARFGFPHPRTRTQVEVRIVPTQDGQYYTTSYQAPGYWLVSMDLEILP
jgi:hypothetical protein